MGLAAMSRLAKERQLQDEKSRAAPETTSGRAGPSPPAATAESVQLSALEKLSGFVPTEVITAWAAAVGLIVPTSSLQRWSIFGGALLLMVGLIVMNSELLSRSEAGLTAAVGGRSRLVRLVVLSSVAFTIWAFAAPGSPAVSWGDGATRIFGVVALFVTPLLHKSAQLWGLAPLDAPTAPNPETGGAPGSN